MIKTAAITNNAGTAEAIGAKPRPVQKRGSHDHLHRPKLPFQTQVKHMYENERVQTFIAGLIITNFLIVCTQKEIDPQAVEYKDVWFNINIVFNVIFLCELLVNLYGKCWCEFWASNWNRFDFTVVSIGIIDLAWTDMPAQLRLVRMLRAFRVFRLFEHVEAMRRIIESIAHAVPGVLNAFLINFILICIYAVLSVDFFSEVYTGCEKDGFEGPSSAVTSRGLCWGYDYYGTFSRALYSMFQVLTGDSWSEAGARPALDYYLTTKSTEYVVITYCFFYSFVLINSFVLLNVVVAVLMDGMNASDTSGEDDSEQNAAEDTTHDELLKSEVRITKGSELADIIKGMAHIQKGMADMQKQINEQHEMLKRVAGHSDATAYAV